MPLVITSRHGGGRRLALTGLGLAAGMAFAGLVAVAAAPKFQPDDPLAREPEPADASRVEPFPIHLSWDLISSLFAKEGEHARRPAQDINTIGEVPDSSWFTNRAGSRPLTDAEVGRGPDTTNGPAPGPWTVMTGKSEGVRPGFTIRDSAGIDWYLKFDPPGYPEQATAAEVVSTKLFWALGYHVAETHVAPLSRANLRLAPDAHITVNGKRRALTAGDISRVLVQAARNADGTYQALASRRLEGKPVGEFLYYGTRSDDPNDVVPHEHRRELRGMVLAAAWLDRVDAKAGNTLDTLVSEGGRTIVRHHVLDFGSTLGSAGIGPNEYWEGHQYLYDGRTAARKLFLFGFPVEGWRHISYPQIRGVGRIDGDHFDPLAWKSRVPNAAYIRADAEDLFWAATKIMAISDGMIAAAVKSGRYSDPAAERYLTETLIKRRNAIGRAALLAVNPVVQPVLDAGGTLRFQNAAVACGLAPAPTSYRTSWAVFDNNTGEVTMSLGTRDSSTTEVTAPAPLPTSPGALIRIELGAMSSTHPVWVTPVRLYFRRGQTSWALVGLERSAVATP